MIKKLKRLIDAFYFVWNGEGLKIEQRLNRAELDLQVLVKSMKAVLLAVDERVQGIADLGRELDTLDRLGRADLATQRLDHILKLCKEVGDLKELLDVTWQMFDVHKEMR